MDRFKMPTYYEELCIQCNDGACCGDCDEDLDEDLFDENLIVVKNGETVEDWISYMSSNPYYNKSEVTS